MFSYTSIYSFYLQLSEQINSVPTERETRIWNVCQCSVGKAYHVLTVLVDLSWNYPQSVNIGWNFGFSSLTRQSRGSCRILHGRSLKNKEHPKIKILWYVACNMVDMHLATQLSFQKILCNLHIHWLENPKSCKKIMTSKN
jgi:hypothetical protein